MKKQLKSRVYKKLTTRRSGSSLSLVIVWNNDRSLKLLFFINKELTYSSTYQHGATTENFLKCLDNFLKKHHQSYKDVKEIYLQNFSTSFSQVRLANVVANIFSHYSRQSFRLIKNSPADLNKLFISGLKSYGGVKIKYPTKAVQ